MGTIKAKQALLRQFGIDGIDVVFGNPGSTEESFLQAVAQQGCVKYFLGLQEASVAAMADGWARTKRKPAVCQVHSAVGLGNGMGVMYQASRAHTPMLVLAGEPPLELQAFDGFLAGDLTALARPLCKWAFRVTHGRQLLRIIRRALKVAHTPPEGAVFLALPQDVLDEEVDETDILPTSFVRPPAACSEEDARHIARLLKEARSPLLVIGDGAGDARVEVRALSHLLGIPVWGMEYNEPILSFRDEMFMGLMGHSFGSNTRKITLQADLILAVGTPMFAELFPTTDPYFTSDAIVIQIDRDPWEIAKNFTVQIGVQADPQATLALVLEEVNRLHLDPEALAVRRRAVAQAKAEAYRAETSDLEAVPDLPDALSPATMMHVLSEELPNGALVYDESITSTAALLHYLRPDDARGYTLARGGCVGVGWPGAVGAAAAEPQRWVVAPSGDGAALFALQTLWTAAKHELKIVFIVCNNSAYRILKINWLHYLRDSGQRPSAYPFMDLAAPRVDFARLAEGFKMRAFCAKTANELRAALREAFAAARGPTLIDVSVNGSVEKEERDIFPPDK